ncbi:MAG: hypothetical protein HN521_00755 [Candidatus Latescibacteria bacterium]|nr:hypothetical protein [Candidatus Latescibacterota bacterium]
MAGFSQILLVGSPNLVARKRGAFTEQMTSRDQLFIKLNVLVDKHWRMDENFLYCSDSTYPLSYSTYSHCMNKSQKSFIFLVVIVLILLSGGIIYTINMLWQLDREIHRVTRIQIDMLMCRRNEKDFFARLDTVYVDQFLKNNTQLIADMADLEQDEKLLPLVEQYRDLFLQAVQKKREIGLHENDGLRGQLRNAVHKVENEIEQQNDDRLMYLMLMCRRSEKDFIIRQDSVYVAQFRTRVAQFQSAIQVKPLTHKELIKEHVAVYHRTFEALASASIAIGLDEQRGITGAMRSAIHRLEPALLKVSERGRVQRQNVFTYLVGICVFFTLFAFTIVVVLSRFLRLNRHLLFEVLERERAELALQKAHDELEEKVRARTIELSDTNVALEKSRDMAENHAREADAANRSKSIFLTNMGHEIRTPLNAIMGFGQILSRTPVDAQEKEYLDSIQDSSKALLALIGDLLDLAKMESGSIDLAYDTIDPRPVFSSLEHVFSQAAAEKELDFKVEIDSAFPSAIVTDETRLRQVLMNLAGNAMKFTHSGSVRVSVSSTSVDNRAIDMMIAVTDTGIGIAPDQLDRIFNAFEQQEGQSVNEYGGTGIGLALTKWLVHAMDGEISVESELGKGSRFEVVLKRVNLPGESSDFDLAVLGDPATLGEAIREKLPELIAALEGEHEQWQTISEGFAIDEVEGFAERMQALGAEYGYTPLVVWAEMLNEHAQTFQVDMMQQGLEAFPNLIAQAKSLANK